MLADKLNLVKKNIENACETAGRSPQEITLIAVSKTKPVEMLKEAYAEAKRLLSEHRDTMDKIAEFLIEKETITGKEFMKIYRECEGIPEPEEEKKEESKEDSKEESKSSNTTTAEEKIEEPVKAEVPEQKKELQVDEDGFILPQDIDEN